MNEINAELIETRAINGQIGYAFGSTSVDGRC